MVYSINTVASDDSSYVTVCSQLLHDVHHLSTLYFVNTIIYCRVLILQSMAGSHLHTSLQLESLLLLLPLV